MRNNPEAKLHIAVVQYLTFACPTLMFFHCPNGGSRDIREAAMLKRMGVKPGVADLLLFWRGGMGALELKAPKGAQSASQKKFQAAWTQRGGLYELCRSMNEVEAVIKGWGLEPNYRPPAANEQSKRLMTMQVAAHQMYRND